jgi:autocrine motility factor receptor
MATLMMALGHYVHIWWLHGMAFHFVDAILFLNIRVNICVNISFYVYLNIEDLMPQYNLLPTYWFIIEI